MNKLNSIVISLFRKWRGYARTEATEFELIVASVIMSGFVIHSGALMYHLQVKTVMRIRKRPSRVGVQLVCTYMLLHLRNYCRLYSVLE